MQDAVSLRSRWTDSFEYHSWISSTRSNNGMVCCNISNPYLHDTCPWLSRQGSEVSRQLGRICVNRGRNLPTERLTHAPQHSHISPGYRYSTPSLQSSCETILQDTSPQASLPQGTDRHCCAAMCIRAIISIQKTTCNNGKKECKTRPVIVWSQALMCDNVKLIPHPLS